MTMTISSIDELLLGTKQKNNSASADPNSNDTVGFIDIDDFLSGIQRNRTRGGSSADSSRSTGSSQGEYTTSLNLARSSYLYDPRSDYTK